MLVGSEWVPCGPIRPKRIGFSPARRRPPGSAQFKPAGAKLPGKLKADLTPPGKTRPAPAAAQAALQ